MAVVLEFLRPQIVQPETAVQRVVARFSERLNKRHPLPMTGIVVSSQGVIVIVNPHLGRPDGIQLRPRLEIEVHDRAGRVYRIAGISDDVTRQKETERALAASEQRFRKLFESGPLGMVMVDADYRVLDANERLCQMLGYTREDANLVVTS